MEPVKQFWIVPWYDMPVGNRCPKRLQVLNIAVRLGGTGDWARQFNVPVQVGGVPCDDIVTARSRYPGDQVMLRVFSRLLQLKSIRQYPDVFGEQAQATGTAQLFEPQQLFLIRIGKQLRPLEAIHMHDGIREVMHPVAMIPMSVSEHYISDVTRG